MSESVFEKLLGSYSGMRKRTWSPSMIEEAAGPEWWAREFSLGDEVDPQTKATQYQTAKANIQAAAAQQGTITPTQAAPQLTTYGQAVATTMGVSVVNRQGKAPRSLKKENVPTVIQALDSLIEKAGTEKSKEPGSEKEEKEAEKGREGLAPMARAEFSQSEREDYSKAIERALGVDPTEAMKIIQGFETTINTPRKGSKVGKFLDILGNDRPELADQAKTELKNATGAYLSVLSKVQTDSQGRSYISASDLTSRERDLLKVTTIRNNGNVSFGRPDNPVEAYKTLQENAQFGNSNYGFALGANLDKLSPALANVRVVESTVDVDAMSDSEFESIDKAFQGSKSGAGGLSNNAVGVFQEYVQELSWARLSGDKAATKEALEKVKTGLEKMGATPVDLDALETALTAEEYDAVREMQELTGQYGDIKVAILNVARRSAETVQQFNDAIGLKQGDVVAVGAPSQESKMGERPDVIAFVKPEASLNMTAFPPGTKLHVVTEDDADLIAQYGEKIIGTTMVNPSIKVQKDDGSTIRAGSGAASRMLGDDTQEYDEHWENTTERLIRDGAMTKRQQKIARKALQRDRAAFDKLGKRLAKLNPKNMKDVTSFLKKMDIADTSIAGKEKFRAEADMLASALQSKDPEAIRQAHIRLHQIYKMRKAATSGKGDDYVRGSTFNEVILSFASTREEPITVQTPTSNLIGSNHAMTAEMSRSIFDPANTVRVDPARSTVTSADGESLFGFRRVARKGKNIATESEISPTAKRRFMKSAG